jgi:HSP20 family protein
MARKETESNVPAAWDPFRELGFFRGWSPLRELDWPRLSSALEELLGPRAARGGRFAPALDIAEDDAKYTVTVELPGAKREDVTCEVKGDVLTIRGEKRSEREERKEKSHWIERSFGSFSRSFTLPEDSAADRVSASFKDGVLTLEIPKTEERKPKAIAIK